MQHPIMRQRPGLLTPSTMVLASAMLPESSQLGMHKTKSSPLTV